VHDGKLVLVRDHSRQSTIHVLDAKTGETIWEHDRDEDNAWATPRVIQHDGRTQDITAASKQIRSYDLEIGDIIWYCAGLTGNVTPCPVVQDDMVYCMSGYEGYSLLALRLSGIGEIKDTDAVVWSRDKGTPYVPSPVLRDNRLYFTQSNQGILSVVDSKTGETVIDRTRLPGIANIYASPVAAAGRIYFVDRDGTTVVLKQSDQFEVLATNKLNDRFDASPALAGSQLFLRGNQFLYCIEDK
jgi:outer membrane protein assembly factor BamB